MENLKVSVAMATYNGEKYIIQQLKSIFEQTHKVDEVVITDDRSSDKTVEVVNRFIKENGLENSWKIEVNEKNLGFEENFKKALSLTDGDIIFCSDQDDYWRENKVETMVSTMKSSGIGVLCSSYLTFSDDDDIKNIKLPQESLELKEIKLTPYNSFLRSLGSVMCIDRSFYLDVKDMWPKGIAHDEFFWCMAIMQNKCFTIDFVSTYRRIHEGQYSGNFGHDKSKRIKYLKSVVDNSDCFSNYASDILKNEKVAKLFNKRKKVHKKRLDLVENGKLRNVFGLVFNLKYFYSKKSFPVEIMLSVRR